VPHHPDNKELFDVTVHKDPKGLPHPSSQTDLLIAAATSGRPIFVFEPCLATHKNGPQTDMPDEEKKEAKEEDNTNPKSTAPPHSMSTNWRFIFLGSMFRLEVVPALTTGAARLAINCTISHFQWGAASRPAWRAAFTAWLVVLILYLCNLVTGSKGEDKPAERDDKGRSIKWKQKLLLDRTLNFFLNYLVKAVWHIIAINVLMALVIVVVQQLIKYEDYTYLDL